MTTNPFFSVITVTLQNLNGLVRTHDSLMQQGCEDYEWIVIDGGSTDGTTEFLQKLNTAKNFKWVSEADNGLYDAMNKGIERACGKYLIFMNAGDLFSRPDVLEKVKAASISSCPDFLYGDAIETCADLSSFFYKQARAASRLSRGMVTYHQAMFYRRELVGDMRYDLHYRIAADYDFTLRFLSVAKNYLYLPFALCVFEPGGVSQRQATQGRKEEYAIRRQAGFPALFCQAVAARQTIALKLKQMAPRLYMWMMKIVQRLPGDALNRLSGRHKGSFFGTSGHHKRRPQSR